MEIPWSFSLLNSISALFFEGCTWIDNISRTSRIFKRKGIVSMVKELFPEFASPPYVAMNVAKGILLPSGKLTEQSAKGWTPSQYSANGIQVVFGIANNAGINS